MKNTLIILSISLLILIISCKKDDDPSSLGCCGEPAIEKEFGNAIAYIPNVFTPNGDGINDLLTVYGDSVSRIISLVIQNNAGVTVFEVSNLIYPDEQANWDGSTEGFIIPGLYELEAILMSDNGVIQTLTGHVCNYLCGSVSILPVDDLTACHFPSQFTGSQFDPSLPSNEQSDCFE